MKTLLEAMTECGEQCKEYCSKHRKKYGVRCVVDLVRFIRNVYEHFREINIDESVQLEKLLFTDYVFFEYFPDLVIQVYQYVTERNLNEAAEIKSAMVKEY